MYDENQPPTLDEYVDDTLYMNDTSNVNHELYYDEHTHDDSNQYETHERSRKYDQVLIDDIFGISDDKNDFDDVIQPQALTPPDVI